MTMTSASAECDAYRTLDIVPLVWGVFVTKLPTCYSATSATSDTRINIILIYGTVFVLTCFTFSNRMINPIESTANIGREAYQYHS